MGATGDGGHFDALADVLADEFTLVSYDRRGNGRSPREDVPLGAELVEALPRHLAGLLVAGVVRAGARRRRPAGCSSP